MMSGQTADDSAELSTGFSFKLFSIIIPHFKEMSPEGKQQFLDDFFISIRKLAHFSLYFTMGIFSLCSIITYKKIGIKTRVTASLIICILYSVSDEIHQYFIPGRSCELRDVLIDASGAILSVFIAVVFLRKIKALTKKLL